MSLESTAKAMPFAQQGKLKAGKVSQVPPLKGQGWGLNMAPKCSMGLSRRPYPKHPVLFHPSSVVHLCYGTIMFSKASPTHGCHKSLAFPCLCCLCLKNTQRLPSRFPDLVHIQHSGLYHHLSPGSLRLPA